MQKWAVEKFHGGMIDRFDDCPPHYAQLLRNFMIDPSGKLFERDGTRLWGTQQLPSAEKVMGLFLGPDQTQFGDWRRRTAFAYSHRKIWASTGGDVSAATGPAAWTELLDPTGTNPAAYNASGNTKAKFQYHDGHYYVSFQNADVYTQPEYHPRPRRIFAKPFYDTAGAADEWVMCNAGIPTMLFLPTPTKTAGANSYVYYFVWAQVYIVNGTTYTYMGEPSGPLTVTAMASPAGGSPTTLAWTGTKPPSINNSLGFAECYPALGDPGVETAPLHLRVYRTKANETLPRLCGTVAAVTGAGDIGSFVDTVPDADLGAPLYTSDGSSPFTEPPPCKLMHIVGDFAYYGGFDIATTQATNSADALFGYPGLIQSVPGIPTSAPLDYTIGLPDHAAALENIDFYPIVFWKNGLARIEGSIDSFGNGTPVVRVISEKVGALCQAAVVKTDRGLIFASLDGLYYTDGFSVKKITDHLNKYYKLFWDGQDATALSRVAAAYHAKTQRFFFATTIGDRTPALPGTPNTVIVGDMKHQTEDGGAAVAELGGADNATSLGNSFLPTALAVEGDTLLVGDLSGYVMAMTIEPETDDETTAYDVAVDPAAAAADFQTTPVVPDYISPMWDLGSTGMKWVTKLWATFKMTFAQSRIFACFTTYRNGQYRSEADKNGKDLREIRETAIEAYELEHDVERRMPKGGLRTKKRQMRLRKALAILYSSLPAGVRVFAAATTAAAPNTAQLAAGAWPTDVVGQSLYLAGDGYTEGWTISVVAGDTVTVLDPGGTFPTGTFEWEIKGYDKISKLGLSKIILGFLPYDGKDDAYQTGDTGENT